MPHTKTRILALDPGTRELGYAAFEGDSLVDYGVKAVRRQSLREAPLARFERAIRTLLREKKPSILVLERNYFIRIKQNALLTIATAKIKAIAKRRGISTKEYHTRTIRRIVCKNGNSTKREVAQIICSRIPELRAYQGSNRKWRERYYHNIFDAVACGLAYLIISHEKR